MVKGSRGPRGNVHSPDAGRLDNGLADRRRNLPIDSDVRIDTDSFKPRAREESRMKEIAIRLVLCMLRQLCQWVDGIIELLVLPIGCGSEQTGLTGISPDLLSKDAWLKQKLEFVQGGFSHPPSGTRDRNGLSLKIRHQQGECGGGWEQAYRYARIKRGSSSSVALKNLPATLKHLDPHLIFLIHQSIILTLIEEPEQFKVNGLQQGLCKIWGIKR